MCVQIHEEAQRKAEAEAAAVLEERQRASEEAAHLAAAAKQRAQSMHQIQAQQESEAKKKCTLLLQVSMSRPHAMLQLVLQCWPNFMAPSCCLDGPHVYVVDVSATQVWSPFRPLFTISQLAFAPAAHSSSPHLTQTSPHAIFFHLTSKSVLTLKVKPSNTSLASP